MYNIINEKIKYIDYTQLKLYKLLIWENKELSPLYY